jgi:hypothetical protein
MPSRAAGSVPAKSPVVSRLAMAAMEPATSTGVSRGKATGSASGAVPTRPITEDLTVRIGRGPVSISTTSTPCRNCSGMGCSNI